MNFIDVLYQEKDWQKVINFLQTQFGSNASAVSLGEDSPDNFVHFYWEGLLDPNELAAEMTKAVPEVIIECESNSGIDLRSRYFNKAQQW